MSLRLVLASASPRRRELLARLALEFDIRAPVGVDESAVGGSAFVLCQELARRKADWVLGELLASGSGDAEDSVATAASAGPTGSIDSGTVVLGCDTVVALVRGGQERVIGKPRSREEAREILRLLSGGTHRVLSGVALARPGRETRVELEVTHVTFRPLEAAVIDAYVESGDADDKAGAYGIQTAGDRLVESIKGCYFNVVGLPLGLVARLLDVEPPCCECDVHPLQGGVRGCEL